MLNRISHLNGSKIAALDGEIGHVREAYFDDHAWAIRYLVVDTGSWLSGRDVLISPYAVKHMPSDAKRIDVALSREQVQHSPPVDTHQPVSRRHESEQLQYYAFPEYWSGTDLWAMGPLPMLPAPLPMSVESAADSARRERDVPAADVHLRSSANVTGYDIRATDDSIGHVADFIFDTDSWAIRALVVDTRNWWPGGKKVLLEVRWIVRIDWADKTVYTSLTRAQIKNGPVADETPSLSRQEGFRLSD